MTVVHALGLLAASSSTSAAKKSSGSSYTFIIFLLVIGVAGYFFLLRPQQQKARKQKEAQSDIGVGDEVLTVGGIVGTVLDINSERVTIVTGAEGADLDGEHAVPTRMVLVRQAIARKIEPTVAGPTYDDVEPVEEYEEHGDGVAHEDEHHEEPEEYPRYEYTSEEKAADEEAASEGGGVTKRDGRRRRARGTNGSGKADRGTGEDTGP